MNFSNLIRQFGRGHKSAGLEGQDEGADFDQYETRAPHNQHAIDLVPGWTSSFPAELGLTAGHLALYADPRLAWAIEKFGDLRDKTVLEVGPLEGMHTYMLHQRSPRRIDAVEANRLSYLRCLVTGQILRLDRAHFMLGDAVEWLARHEQRYDLIVASGVLYHMSDPVRFLELAAARSDALFLWTHYFLPEAMPRDDVRRRPFTGKEIVRSAHGLDLRLYERNYQKTPPDASFCGGPRDRHYWMHKQDILDLLKALGFTSIDIDGDDQSHSGGPCFSLFARRD